MKFIRHEGSEERHAIVAMVLSSEVLGAVAPVWQSDSFGSRMANVIAGWCVEHWNKYQQAPGIAGITAHFDLWKISADDTLAQTLEQWLTGLPEESGLGDQYAIDLIQNIVQTQSLKKLGNSLVALAEKGKVEDAVNMQAAWKRPKIGQEASGVFPLQDAKVIQSAFQYSTQEPLIKYKGALGEFFGGILCRDAFVSFLAPDKTGKTTVLGDIAMRGVHQGHRVALLSVGDMSQDQVILRLSPRVCNRPLAGGKFQVPVSMSYTKENGADIVWEDHIAQPVTCDQAVEQWQKYGNSGPDRFRLLTHAAGTFGSADLAATAQRWADEGWSPDIIVVDYADILAPPPGYKEKRDQINKTWEQLRAISTQFRCLVVTATQSDADGYSSWLLSKKNFSDSKTKNAHVTAMIGLNMTEADRKNRTCRYNYVALREAEFMEGRPAYVAVTGCTRIGRPSMLSCWPE